MSIERAMIDRAAPRMLAGRIQLAIDAEIAKGCCPSISQNPVELEPTFIPFGAGVSALPMVEILLRALPTEQQLLRFRVWISPDQKCDWNRSELFLKQLLRARHRVAFEISGNSRQLSIHLLVHEEDAMLVITAFRANFHQCEVSQDSEAPLAVHTANSDMHVNLIDIYPPPPYSHLLTCCEEIKTPPFATLLQALSALDDLSTGFYQCVFQPVAQGHDWHTNVGILHDLEYEIKLNTTINVGRQYLQQAPSGDLHHMAQVVDTKAHNDRPFFCAAVRVGIISESKCPEVTLRTLGAFMNVFQHGGRPLEQVDTTDYLRVLRPEQLLPMVRRAITYRPGFLINSHELVGLANVFSAPVVEERRLPLQPLERLPPRDDALFAGTPIGVCTHAGVDRIVCIPDSVRQRSTHIVSKPGMGKSNLLLHMFLHDISQGLGCVLIDIHGDAVKRASALIPESLQHKVIYFNPGDPEWIPQWNPLSCSDGQDIYRLADDIVASFRRVFSDWGDRLEHVIRNGLIGLLYLGRASMLDLYSLVRQGSPESEALRRQIVDVVIDEPVRQFWLKDFLKDYRKADLQAPKHKLSKLVSAGSVSLMLSQPHSLIDFADVMRERKILLVDLSRLGHEVADILGSFILSVLFTTAMRRSEIAEGSREPFSIFADEAHRFVSAGAIEQLITEARKFGINLTIAHQYLAQFATRRVDAISTTGSTIVGCVDKHDSQYFAKDMRDMVTPNELMALKPYEMIAKIGSEVVRLKTLPPKPTNPAVGMAILENSRKRYCQPIQDIRQKLSRGPARSGDMEGIPAASSLGWTFTEEQLRYDEF